jgi:pyridinium-3,5-biscarboxylic acid mononucleotide sulfurtransferase
MGAVRRQVRADRTLERLTSLIRRLGVPVVAFSGGVDSALVALAAYRAHPVSAVAVTVLSELIPDSELARAEEVAAFIGIRHETLRLDVLGLKRLPDNPPDRCYHCKKAVFKSISRIGKKLGATVVLDGTNSDDAGMYRPGLKALAELGVASPLAQLGIAKSDVRALARAAGLPNWDTPSRPCLATRFPYGERLDPGRIRRVHEAEDFLDSLGFSEFRVRDHAGLARVELTGPEMKKALSGGTAKKIVAKLVSLGYNYVTLDLEGFRSGSMDKGVDASGPCKSRRRMPGGKKPADDAGIRRS